MAQLNAANVFRQVRDRLDVSLFDVTPFLSNKKPLPQASSPTQEELRRGGEKIKVKDMNNAPEKKLVLEKTNKPNDGDWLVISLKKDGSVVEKKKTPYYGCRIHNQIFGCFKGLGRSGRRRFQERS